jgi:HK97 family phage portal protein
MPSLQSPPRLPVLPRLRAAAATYVATGSLKAAKLTFTGWGGSAWGYGSGYGGNVSSIDRWQYGLPGTNVDWASLAGDLWQSSVVAICLTWIARNINEPALCVQARRKRGGEAEDDLDHPLCALVNDPNPYYGSDALWAATAASYCTSGNAYWFKGRSGRRVKELYYIPHWQIRPVWPEDGSKFISGYAYRAEGRQPTIYAPEDIIHFRFGLDLYNYRMGWNPLGAQLRQIGLDNEASTYEVSVLQNMGIVPVMLSPADKEAGLTEDQRKELGERINSKFTGDGRGQWMVVGVPMRADVLAASPEKLAIPSLRHGSVTRICASLGLTPMLLGLSEGDGALTYANKGAARQEAYQDCLIPMGKTWAGALTHQLGPDFGLTPSEEVGWNYDDVEALAEDADAKSKRATEQWMAGGRTRNEYRKAIGLKEEGKTGDVYLLAKGASLIDAAGNPVGEVSKPKEPKGPPKPPVLPVVPRAGTQGDQAALTGGNGNGRGAASGQEAGVLAANRKA